MKAELVDAQTASSIIAEKDDYILNFSEFDLQSRLSTTEKVTKDDLVEFLSQQTVEWITSEENIINRIFDELNISYEPYKKYLLDSVKIIKTTGREECDAAYTRNKSIYVPISMVQWPYDELKELIAHELFHVVSTHNPKFRKDLYVKLGFNSCPELDVPTEYKQLYVSNPDTIGKNCYVAIQINGSKIKAVPFLYSETPYRGGYFFEYFRFTFLESEMKDKKCSPFYENNRPKFIDAPQKLFDLCEEIDPYDNQHRLHPEEILAYYWSLLPFSESRIQSYKRSYLVKIRNLLEQEGASVFS
ncbi:MAG: hypothetical protein KGD67_03900 [Candidatus Lokiarchaeota archaeon]|nr:hypothetical protein [Candidatus Lokiarchaeota archaeon]